MFGMKSRHGESNQKRKKHLWGSKKIAPSVLDRNLLKHHNTGLFLVKQQLCMGSCICIQMWECVWVCLCICICGEVWVIAVRGYLRRHAEIQNGRVASGIQPDVPCRVQYIAWLAWGSLRCTLVPWSSLECGRTMWFCWKRRTIWVIWGHGAGGAWGGRRDWPTDHHWTTQDPQHSMLCYILNAMLCVN